MAALPLDILRIAHYKRDISCILSFLNDDLVDFAKKGINGHLDLHFDFFKMVLEELSSMDVITIMVQLQILGMYSSLIRIVNHH